jgi:hypothetical protein
MEKLPRLSDEYLEQAKEMVARHRKAKKCKLCYDRGYQGVNQDNMLVPCSKCVDTDAVLKEWTAYVRNTPELAELYGDYYAEAEEEEGT